MTTQTTKYWAVIPAAGVGSRMGADIPKQYLSLNGKKVIEHTLQTLLDHPRISGAVVALSKDDRWWDTVHVDTSKPIYTTNGGSERCLSVLNALELLSQYAGVHDWVLVHDAARPCVRREDIDRLMEELTDHPLGGLLAIPVRDTMKRADAQRNVEITEDRTGLWHALTPQMFHLKPLMDALQRTLESHTLVTDEAQAVEMTGARPLLVEGHADNIKITRPEDLQLAAFYLSQRESRESPPR